MRLIIIIIIIIIIITFMHGMHHCISETNHVSRVYNIAAILWLQSVVDVVLLPMLNVL